MHYDFKDFQSYAFDILDQIRDDRPRELDHQESEEDEPYDDHIPNDNYRNRIDTTRLDPDRQGNDNSFELDPEEEEIIDGKIKEGGFEVLAFYKSIHHLHKNPYPGQWGIFVYDWAPDNSANRQLPFMAGTIAITPATGPGG